MTSHPPFRAPLAHARTILARVRWFNLAVLVLTPAGAACGILCAGVAPDTRTLVFAATYYVFSMLGITAGYHRLFSHRSYTATPLLRAALLLAGAAAVQGSALWWARTHRAHHRFADAPGDPYSITKGLLHAHFGWVLLREDDADPAVREGRERRKVIKVADLIKDPLVCWQHTCYFPLALAMGFALPAAIPGLAWGDWRGGWYAAALARLFFVHHCTFAINSLAHWFGSAPYDDDQSARDSVLSALLTLGEGYHNFHHEFPADYRNAVHWMGFDPTKWFIATCAVLRLAKGLRRAPSHAIAKGALAMRLKAAAAEQAALPWPRARGELEVWTRDDFCARTAQPERVLLLVAGYIHDATAFSSQHPGGAPVLRAAAARGADATTRFFGDGDIGKEGGGYRHSSAAQNMLAMMRVAALAEDAACALEVGTAHHDEGADREGLSRCETTAHRALNAERAIPPGSRLFVAAAPIKSHASTGDDRQVGRAELRA